MRGQKIDVWDRKENISKKSALRSASDGTERAEEQVTAFCFGI